MKLNESTEFSLKQNDFHHQMKEWRKSLHQIPELGFQELKTSQFIYELLKQWGLDEIHQGVGRTGIVATFFGEGRSPANPGPAIGLRADMDALKLTEENDFEYKSQHPGNMHACGHDGHCAMLLGAIKELSQQIKNTGKRPPGTIHFIFQPAEEGLGGAKVMMEDGLFTRFPMEAVFGLHNWPSLPLGKVGATTGPVMAASDYVEITVTGKGGHAALPHQTIDPILVAAQFICQVQTIVSRRANPLEGHVISLTQINGGSAFNIIPSVVKIVGSCRSLTHEGQDLIEKSLKDMGQGLALATGAEIKVDYQRRYPPTINSKDETELVAKVAKEIVGESNVLTNLPPSMGAEDFSYFLQVKPGCYFWLGTGMNEHSAGAGNENKKDIPIHHPSYDFNDRVLSLGAQIWIKIINEYFKSQKSPHQ
jgi:amidohydrolase